MRLVVGIALVVRRMIELQSAPPISLAVIHVLAMASGILLLAGLWTPIAGVLLAIIEIWGAFAHPHDPWSYILLGTFGAALPCSDRELGPSTRVFLDGSASTFEVERIKSPTTFELVPSPRKRAFLLFQYGVYGDSIWGCPQAGPAPQCAT
jgi:hypothetical protein